MFVSAGVWGGGGPYIYHAPDFLFFLFISFLFSEGEREFPNGWHTNLFEFHEMYHGISLNFPRKITRLISPRNFENFTNLFCQVYKLIYLLRNRPDHCCYYKI